jgi:hypothetical protein
MTCGGSWCAAYKGDHAPRPTPWRSIVDVLADLRRRQKGTRRRKLQSPASPALEAHAPRRQAAGEVERVLVWRRGLLPLLGRRQRTAVGSRRTPNPHDGPLTTAVLSYTPEELVPLWMLGVERRRV